MGIFNNYVITPRDTVQYSAFRGITDFTKISQFDQYETGYPWLAVIGVPEYVKDNCRFDNKLKKAFSQYVYALEHEFRGLSGLPDTTAETMDITDGINTQKLINKVVRETSVTVSMPYFEKRGGLFTKIGEYILTGIKDPLSQAKTYHGAIRAGRLLPGPENEIFTFLYWTTDNTMLRVEKAFLLANAQLTKSETSIYDGTRGEIGNKEVSLEFNAYAISGMEVDMAAYTLLQDITGVKIDIKGDIEKASNYHDISMGDNEYKKAALDSSGESFSYGIFGGKNTNGDIDIINQNVILSGAVSRAKKGYSWEDPNGYAVAPK